MIKHISNRNILTTPFTAVKGWTLFNTISDDLVLLETNDFFVAFEYVNFYQSPPIIDRICNIALQYNTSTDAQIEEGISGSGFFYSDTEAQNRNGTYKRLVYAQTAQAFYNTYHNPIQIFGMDNIDFPLSRTNRNLGNQFLLFSISRNVMGDKLVEGSIRMYDLFLDDNAIITDDRYGNLIIGNNLFSKIQEVRHIENIIVADEIANTDCPIPIEITTTTTTTTTPSTTSTTSTTTTTPSTTSTTTTTTPTTTTTTTTTPTTTTTTTTPTTTTTTTTPTTTTTTTTTTTPTTTTTTTTTPTTTTTTTTTTSLPGDYFIAFKLTNTSLTCDAVVTLNTATNATTLDGTTVNFTNTNYGTPTIPPSNVEILDKAGVADAFFSIGPPVGVGEWDNIAVSIDHTRYTDGGAPPCDVPSYFTFDYSYRDIYNATIAQYSAVPGPPAGTSGDPFIINIPTS